MTPDLEQALLRHAVGRGLLTAPQAQRALEVQARERAQGRPQDVLTVLRRLGLEPELLAALEQEARRLAPAQPVAATLDAPPPVASTLHTPPPGPTPLRADPLLGQAAAAYARAAAACPRFAPHAEHALEHVGALGEGGMGVVLRVKDRRLGREAALKLMRDAADPGSVARFVREAELTARLDHPAIPPVYEAGVDARGRTYMLMRLIDGQPLSERIATFHAAGRPPALERELLEALVKVTEAVAYAHSQGVIHRDLKPANVMVGKFGEVLVMDWGLARDARRADDLPRAAGGDAPGHDAPAGPGLTQAGATLGTPGYMPPEQIGGGERVDARADVFALGAILTEVLTGRPPVTGTTVVNILTHTVAGRIERPRSRRPDVAPELDAIAAHALAPDPAHRTAAAAAFLQDLRAYLAGEPVTVHRYSLGERLVRAARRRPTLLVAGAAGLLLVTVASWAAVWVARTEEQAAGAERRAREAARAQAVEAAADAAGEARARATEAPAEARLGLGLGWLQAAQRWRDLAPDDAAAGREQVDAALALHRTALDQEQWALAGQVLDRARGLGRDGEVDEGLARVAERRDAAALRRRAAVEATLARVESGEARRRPDGLAEAVFEVVRHADPGVVESLAQRLVQVAVALREVERAALLEGLDEGRAAALRDALDRCDAAPLDRDPPDAAAEAVERALARLDERQLAGRARSAFEARPALKAIAARQGEEAGEGALDLARVAALALGRVGLADGSWPPPLVAQVVEALGRLALVAADEPLAASAGRSLRRIGGAPARRLLSRARARFGPNSAYARQVASEVTADDGGDEDDLPAAPTPARALARRAQERLERGDLTGADADAAKALTAAATPEDRAHALEVRGGVRRARGDLAGARADLEAALRDVPGQVVLHVSLSRLLLEAGDPLAAETAAEAALRLDGRCAAALVNRGEARRRRGEVPRALEDLEEALRLEPELVEALAGRGLARAALGDHAGARADLDAALARDPQRAPLWVARAVLRLTAGDAPGAREDAERALDLDPREAGVRYARGLVRHAQGDAAGARRDLDQALERDPGMVPALLARARALHALEQARPCVRDLDRLLDLAPAVAEGWGLRARVRFDLGDLEASAADADRALALDDAQPDALAVRGRLRGLRGDVAGARADAEAALRRDPGHVEALLLRAEVALAAGDLHALGGAVSDVLARWPDEPRAYYFRAAARQARGDLQGALQDLDHALRLRPGSVEVLCARAALRLNAGEYAPALADLDLALQVQADHPLALAYRGQGRAAAGDRAGAVADLSRMVERHPAHALTARCREVLEALRAGR
ncbi:MAG: protein kinase [Planctomycetes bacterium]|nr:protein kinase [Planctomycetota bacterium]